MGYMAVEPLVRRIWPRNLISWYRVLAGSISRSIGGAADCIGRTGGDWASADEIAGRVCGRLDGRGVSHSATNEAVAIARGRFLAG